MTEVPGPRPEPPTAEIPLGAPGEPSQQPQESRTRRVGRWFQQSPRRTKDWVKKTPGRWHENHSIGYWSDYSNTKRVYDTDTFMGNIESRYINRKLTVEEDALTVVEQIKRPFEPVRRLRQRRAAAAERLETFKGFDRKVKAGAPLAGKEPEDLGAIYIAEKSKDKRYSRIKAFPTGGEAFILGTIGAVGTTASAAVEFYSPNPTFQAAARLVEVGAMSGLAGVGLAWDSIENFFNKYFGKKSTAVSQNTYKGNFGRKLAIFEGIPAVAGIIKLVDTGWDKIAQRLGEGNQYVEIAHNVVDILSKPVEPKLLPGYFGLMTYGVLKSRKIRREQTKLVEKIKTTIDFHNENVANTGGSTDSIIKGAELDKMI